MINRDNWVEHLVEEQFSIIGKTVQDALTEDWRLKWYLTNDQYINFEIKSIALIKKVFKCNRAKAQARFDWFRFQFGLPILK